MQFGQTGHRCLTMPNSGFQGSALMAREGAISNSTPVALLQSPDGLDNWFASRLSSSVPPDLEAAFDMGEPRN